MTLDRIVVETPPSDSSRIRVEPRMFERLDAIRAGERAGDLAPDRRGDPRWRYAAVTGIAIAVAIIAVLVIQPHHPGTVAAPSLVTTPIGGSSRFTIDDAVIDVGGDTSVMVQAGDGGAVILVLSRGTIDCDVAPRHGRPFRVVAGDVEVDVVGTRFAVTRDPNVHVDVTHGKVRVRTAGDDRFVSGGERWSAPSVEPVPPPLLPSPPSPPSPAVVRPEDPPPAIPRATPHEAFIEAQRLEQRDPTAAAKAYRVVANGRDRWAALALYVLAELETTHHQATEALVAVDEYRRRFPHGASAEDAAWLRVETLRTLGRAPDAREAAADYVRRFPNGTYHDSAARSASPP